MKKIREMGIAEVVAEIHPLWSTGASVPDPLGGWPSMAHRLLWYLRLIERVAAGRKRPADLPGQSKLFPESEAS